MSHWADYQCKNANSGIDEELHTASDKAVNQRFFAFEEVLIQYLFPMVAMEHELVLEEIHEGPLKSVGW